ncbi:hypothetical protein I5R92_17170 [Pseudomonas carnis]|uniref:hypothetical protein n=1 Tax=Pseudomonas carnis TaxID=2487355 RepID=UPI0018D82EDA|nr:hypothetical protein [Pseudomonas carnis]MBH3369021.1 hypothetical protein [Pseudomonas carnis]
MMHTQADDQHTPPSFLEGVLSLLEQHAPALAPTARERAATAFIRSLEWMTDNPSAWEIKPVQPITYINPLDKPIKTIVRGRVVDIYKAITL